MVVKFTQEQKNLAKITASKLDLTVQCAHWVTLKLASDSPSQAGIYGTAFHELVSKGKHTATLDPEEERLLQNRFVGWQEHGAPLLPSSCRHEVAFVLKPDGTAVELGSFLERSYGGVIGLCGTLDIVSPERIVDFKTGRRYVTAQDAWQLKFASVVTKVGAAEFHYVDWQGRVQVDAAAYSEVERFGFRKRLLTLIDDVLAGRTPANPGPHCDQNYCRGRKSCAAYSEMKTQQKPNGATMAYTPNIQTGFKKDPLFLVVHGQEGVGKSSLVAGAPAPIFDDAEKKAAAIGIAREVPASWSDRLGLIEYLRTADHPYKTYVGDTADAMEVMLHAHLCREAQKNSIEEIGGGFGKGLRLAAETFARYLDELDRLRFERGMHVMILAHSAIRTFNNPEGADYDRWEMKLDKRVAALLRERSTACLFARFDVAVKADKNKAIGLSTGERVVNTMHNAAWDAKNTLDLPEQFTLEPPPNGWAKLAGFIKAYYAKRMAPEQAA